MSAIFADTFHWTALTHPSDFHREQALALESEILGRRLIVITEEVLVEYLTFFANKGSYWRLPAAAIVRRLALEPGAKPTA